MKKILALCFSALLLCGCSSGKKVACTMNDNSMGIPVTQTITLQGDEDIKNIEVKMELDVSTEEEETQKAFMALMQASLAETESTEGVTTDVQLKSGVILVTMKIDPAKAGAGSGEELAGVASGKMEEAVKALEDEGFTCK